MKKAFVLIVFFFFISGLVSAAKISMEDSLKNLLQTAQDTQRVKILLSLSNIYMDEGKNREVIIYARQALQQSKELNFKLGIADAFRNIGIAYSYKNDFSNSLSNFFEALKLFEELKCVEKKSYLLNNISSIYRRLFDHKNAVKYSSEAIKAAEQTGDQWAISRALGVMGANLHGQKIYHRALEYYSKSLKLAEKIGDKRGMGRSLANIGLIFLEQDSFKKARQFVNKALKIDEEISAKYGITHCHLSLADIYSKEGHFTEAFDEFEKSLALSKKWEFKDIEKEIYQSQYDAAKKMKDYKSAFKYIQKYHTLQDSMLNSETTKQISEMGSIYETEKKEKEILLLTRASEIQKLELSKTEEELNRQRAIIISTIIGLILLIALLFVLYNRYQFKHRANAKLSQAYGQIEVRNKQITDSINYAKRIQESILPRKGEMDKHLEDLFIFFRPRDIVSGDFYWFASKGEKVFLVLADCTGHGVPGAFMSIIGHNLLNEIINEKQIRNASEILHLLHQEVMHVLQQDKSDLQSQGDGMDISICIIDKSRHELEFAGANQNLFLVHKIGIEIVKGDIYSIGGMFDQQEVEFTTHQKTVQKETCVYMSSDGYCDQFGGDENEKFMISRFETMLVDIPKGSMAEQEKEISQRFDDWKRNHKQMDDVLVMGFKI